MRLAPPSATPPPRRPLYSRQVGPRRQHRRQPPVPRLLQVLQLLRRQRRDGCWRRWARLADGRRSTSSCPVGISFYTFQSMSYVIDVYRRRPRADATTCCDFALFVASSRTSSPGPIVRATPAPAPDRREPRSSTCDQVDRGCYLILLGPVQEGRDRRQPGAASSTGRSPRRRALVGGGTALVGVYAFAIQIYCDFSGYTDIAAARHAAGLRAACRTSTCPTSPRTRSDFWRRWHICLSHLAARLPLHPARRQPRRRAAHVPQPDAHHGPRRPLARRDLDVRRLGLGSRLLLCSTALASPASTASSIPRGPPSKRPAEPPHRA